MGQQRSPSANSPSRVHAFPILVAVSLGLGACANLTAARPALMVSPNPVSSTVYRDADLIRAHPALLKRQGPVLIARGKTYVDRGNCDDGDCVRYSVDGVWKGEYVGIEVNDYEESNYLLLTGNEALEIGARPIPSPGGTRFFVGSHDDRRWSPYQGASVWEWDPHPRRLRVVDTDLVRFDEFVSWKGETCIAFRGARGFNVRSEPTKMFWLAEQEGDWRVFESEPSSCRS